MLNQIFIGLTDLLNEYLNAFYEIPEGVVKLGMPPCQGEEAPNKMVLSFLNIERETAMGVVSSYRKGNQGDFTLNAPVWHLNVYFMVSAAYDERRYGEALKVFSGTIACLQLHPVVRIDHQAYTVEPVNLNTQELTNIWSIWGGKYYPSLVCKLRMLTVSGDEAKRTAEAVRGTSTETYS